MKTYLIISLIFAAAVTTASAQSPRANKAASQSLTAPIAGKKAQQRARQRQPAPIRDGDVSGVLARAARGGNPLQMFNPKAPAIYGTAEESVTYDQNDPAKWRGIKLIEIRF